MSFHHTDSVITAPVNNDDRDYPDFMAKARNWMKTTILEKGADYESQGQYLNAMKFLGSPVLIWLTLFNADFDFIVNALVTFGRLSCKLQQIPDARVFYSGAKMMCERSKPPITKYNIDGLIAELPKTQETEIGSSFRGFGRICKVYGTNDPICLKLYGGTIIKRLHRFKQYRIRLSNSTKSIEEAYYKLSQFWFVWSSLVGCLAEKDKAELNYPDLQIALGDLSVKTGNYQRARTLYADALSKLSETDKRQGFTLGIVLNKIKSLNLILDGENKEPDQVLPIVKSLAKLSPFSPFVHYGSNEPWLGGLGKNVLVDDDDEEEDTEEPGKRQKIGTKIRESKGCVNKTPSNTWGATLGRGGYIGVFATEKLAWEAVSELKKRIQAIPDDEIVSVTLAYRKEVRDDRYSKNDSKKKKVRLDDEDDVDFNELVDLVPANGMTVEGNNMTLKERLEQEQQRRREEDGKLMRNATVGHVNRTPSDTWSAKLGNTHIGTFETKELAKDAVAELMKRLEHTTRDAVSVAEDYKQEIRDARYSN